MNDGDGNLVKKTKPDGSKTLYPSTTPQKAAASLRAGSGGIYEVDKTSGGTVTRTVTYYPAGGAMRINITGGSNTLYYVLKDHLGSASVVTSDSGAPLGEQRYYPYGETRFTSGTIYTDKLFTGQREMAGLGIYHYGARFYSQKLGRFLSPDTIVPVAANPQAYNRYSYVLGNPIRYNDPTGHAIACEADEDCKEVRRAAKLSAGQAAREALKKYKVKLKGNGWNDENSMAAFLGVMAVVNKLGGADAFSKVFKNGVNFTWGGEDAGYGCTSVTSGGCTSSDSQINFWSMSNDMVKNVVHELGHAFYKAAGNPLLGDSFSRKALIRNASYAGGEALVWEQHPISMNKDGKDIPHELFADTFIAWTYDTWNSDPDPLIVNAVDTARNEMDRIASSIP